MSVSRSLCIAVVLWAISWASQTEAVVVTFPFDEPMYWSYPEGRWCVGPRGDVWFVLYDPPRLMRISAGQLETMYEADLHANMAIADVAVSPDGTIYVDNFQYQFTEGPGLAETGVKPPATTTSYRLRFTELDSESHSSAFTTPGIT